MAEEIKHPHCVGNYEPVEAHGDTECDGGVGVEPGEADEKPCAWRDRCKAIQAVSVVEGCLPEELLQKLSVDEILTMHEMSREAPEEETIEETEEEISESDEGEISTPPPGETKAAETEPVDPGTEPSLEEGEEVEEQRRLDPADILADVYRNIGGKLKEAGQALAEVGVMLEEIPNLGILSLRDSSRIPTAGRVGSKARPRVKIMDIAKKMRMPYYQAERGYKILVSGDHLKIPEDSPNPFRETSAWGLVFREYQQGGTIGEIVAKAKARLRAVRRVEGPREKG